MASTTVTTQIMREDDRKIPLRSIDVAFDFGDNLASAVALFGESVVYEHFVDSATIALQAFIRGRLKATGEKAQTDAMIADAVKKWKPSQRKPADPAKRAETVKKLAGSMTEEQRKALIAELQASLAPVAKPTTRKGKAA